MPTSPQWHGIFNPRGVLVAVVRSEPSQGYVTNTYGEGYFSAPVIVQRWFP